MRRPVEAPRRMRRRLTVTFVAVAGVAAGTLALGSFLLVRQARLDDSLRRASDETRRDLTLVAGLAVDGDLRRRVDDFLRERGVRAVAVTGSGSVASDPSLHPRIPPGLRELVRAGRLAYERIDVRGAPYLVVGGRPPDSEVELYFLFPEDRLDADLRQLGLVLAVGWGLVVLLAAAVGRLVAGRTLAPVAEASRAARSLAEGLLATRLPVEAADEFGQWAASFNEMAEALEGKIAALQEAQARERRFTSDVAHELRTPLTALVSEAAILRQHLDRMPEDARRPARLLVDDVARLRTLVEDLMEISRLDSGAEPLIRERLDLGKLVAATLAARGWTDRVRVEATPIAVESDRRRLERVVSNLVGNAIEHGGGDVEIRVGSDGAAAFVRVSDRGPGIPRVHLARVFDRFYKADPSRSGGGSGLGLSIARENARVLGGDVVVASEMGAGASFTLRLPVAERLRGGDPRVASGEEHGGDGEEGGER